MNLINNIIIFCTITNTICIILAILAILINKKNYEDEEFIIKIEIVNLNERVKKLEGDRNELR